MSGAGAGGTIRLDLQYDGGRFKGWARQPGSVTVEGTLRAALGRVLGVEVGLSVAGRTDAGVHARRQVASLEVPGDVFERRALDAEEGRSRLRGSLNDLTPAGLSVLTVSAAPPAFDARRDARARSYRYFIWRPEVENPFLRAYAWHLCGSLDVAAMAETARAVEGLHDFTAFTPTETEHVLMTRIVKRCRWRERGPVLWLEVTAPTFMRHMVRALVGTMVEVGRGRRTPTEFAALLAGAERGDAGLTAPPHGLFLWRVDYEPARLDTL